MEYTQIDVERRGPITIIRFDRPEVMNCIGLTTHHELVHAWDRFRDDDDAKVAIITGTGDRAFCAGGDLTGEVNLTATGDSREQPASSRSTLPSASRADGGTSGSPTAGPSGSPASSAWAGPWT